MLRDQTIHYRAIFHVRPKNELSNSWGVLVSDIRNWIASKVPKEDQFKSSTFHKGGFKWSPKDGASQVITSSCYEGGEFPESWAVRLDQPCSDYQHQRDWRTEIGVSVLGPDFFAFAITVSHSLRPGYLGQLPEVPPPTTPAIVSQLVSKRSLWDIRAGDEWLLDTPIEVPKSLAKEFLGRLEAENRLCPIVYVSRNKLDAEPAVNIKILSRVLRGTASVYIAESADAEHEIAQLLPNEFKCMLGSIRVYQPKLDLSKPEDARRHRFFRVSSINDQSEIIGYLVRGLARQSRLWIRPPILGIDDVMERFRKQHFSKMLSDARNSKEANNSISQEWLDDYERTLARIDELRNSNEALELQLIDRDDQINDLNDQISQQKYEIDLLRKQFEFKTSSAPESDKLRVFSALPSNLHDALQKIQSLFPERLVILDEASKAAAQDGFSDINAAWECLWACANDLWELLFDGQPVGDIESKFKSKTGFELSLSETSLTKQDNKLMGLRKRNYLETQVDITPHLKLDKGKEFLRIHYYVDRNNKKIVIGHCGDHLDTAGTRRRRL